ncbi:fused MFS/spermidine synthase [Kiloniella majae]|uniref:fused MFS/spermidine synthase n=1 Tax=Kiloniella majae TaxID=1938558 RepID=UPI000F770493|nr:fused MFS/spermidine synthase [Kiloniella majae]
MNSKNHAVDTQSSTFLRYLFILTLCSSAFLLFLIQPMFTKLVLPLLGGAPAVWNTAMIFFQSVLLAGYLYAHFLSSAFKLRNQIIIHLVLMAIAMLFLPIAIPTEYEIPSENWPSMWLLGLFTVAIGLPFFIISANAPLLQDWFRSSSDKDANDPYFLYAASNIGSIAALAAYPLFIEVQFGLVTQTWLWSYGFVALLILIFICGVILKRQKQTVSPLVSQTANHKNQSAPNVKSYINWIILALIPSALLLSLTNKITTDLLATPLLWVFPLILYLLTFVIVFSKHQIIPHHIVEKLTPYCLILITFLNVSVTQASTIIFFTIGNLFCFFVLALYSHGLLAASRPDAKYLTNFYIAMSFGGVLGGIFISMIAPVIFSDVYEYIILLIIIALIMPRKTKTLVAIVKKRVGPKAQSYSADIIFSLILIGLFLARFQIEENDIISKLISTILLSLLLLIILEGVGRPFRLALTVAIGLFVIPLLKGSQHDILFQERSFFGVYAVKKLTTESKSDRSFKETAHLAKHGTTIHGIQIKGSLEPQSYYHKETGLGKLLEAYDNKNINSVAVIGLGTGTAICYRQAGQHWSFFEIDPLVETMARNPKLFDYMQECAQETEVIIGDARLSLKNISDATYDLLIADAFSSDAIPIHLMTKEAFNLYKKKVKDNGIIILHISNRYFDLEPIVAATAKASNLKARIYDYTRPQSDIKQHPYRYSATWVALAQDSKTLDDLIPLTGTKDDKENLGWRELSHKENVKAWTDDYSNVLSALK